MKTLRQFCAAVILTSVFSVSALGGDMDTGRTPPPPPPTIAGDMDTGRTTPPTITGDMDTGRTTSGEAADPIMQMALMLLQSILSPF